MIMFYHSSLLFGQTSDASRTLLELAPRGCSTRSIAFKRERLFLRGVGAKGIYGSLGGTMSGVALPIQSQAVSGESLLECVGKHRHAGIGSCWESGAYLRFWRPIYPSADSTGLRRGLCGSSL